MMNGVVMDELAVGVVVLGVIVIERGLGSESL